MAHRSELKTTEQRKREVQLWVLGVLKQKGWTAGEWARRANVTHTTLTRFLNDESWKYSLTGTTIERLARAANVSPMISRTFSPHVFVAVISRSDIEGAVATKGLKQVDLFRIDTNNKLPAPPEMEDCIVVEMSDGMLAFVRNSKPSYEQPVLVLRRDESQSISIRAAYYNNGTLIPVDSSREQWHVDDPGIRIIGDFVAEIRRIEPRPARIVRRSA